MQYALVLNDTIIRYHEFNEETPPELSANKGVWLPVVDEGGDEPGPGETTSTEIIVETTQVRHVTTVVEKLLEDVKAVKREQINSSFTAANETPFSWNFGEIEAKSDNADPTAGTSLGDAEVQTLQTRAIDEKNWLAAQVAAMTAAMGGASTMVQPIKTTANIWVQTTAAQVMQVLVIGDGTQESLFGRQLRNLANNGALKKALADATTVAEVLAIDETAGW